MQSIKSLRMCQSGLSREMASLQVFFCVALNFKVLSQMIRITESVIPMLLSFRLEALEALHLMASCQFYRLDSCLETVISDSLIRSKI